MSTLDQLQAFNSQFNQLQITVEGSLTLSQYDQIYLTLSNILQLIAEDSTSNFKHFSSKKFTEATDTSGALVMLNVQKSNVWLDDLTIVSFENMFFQILLSLLQKKKHDLQPTNFLQVMLLAADLYAATKNILLKKFINFTYGLLGSKKNIYGATNVNLANNVLQRSRLILTNIVQKFSGHYVYVDTDQIVFQHYAEIQTRIEDYLQQPQTLNLPYSVEYHRSGIFLAKKKFFMATRDGQNLYSLQLKGLQQRI